MTSISRQLIFWLAIPLMLMALFGALVQYFNVIAPSVLSSDRRLKEASNSIMSHLVFKDGALSLNEAELTGRSDFKFAVRDPRGRLLSGDPAVPNQTMNGENGQLFSVVQVENRSLRMLTTRLEREGIVFQIGVEPVRIDLLSRSMVSTS